MFFFRPVIPCKDLFSIMSAIDVVTIVEREYHASCAYCGATEGDNWVTGNSRLRPNRIYCSSDCRWADELPISSCLLLLAIPISFILMSEVSRYVGSLMGWLPPLMILLFLLYPIIAVILGIRASARVSQKSRIEHNYH